MSTTVSAKPAEVRREWLLVDAEGKTPVVWPPRLPVV